jgi:hypothetical protein
MGGPKRQQHREVAVRFRTEKELWNSGTHLLVRNGQFRAYLSVCCRVRTRMWVEPSLPQLLGDGLRSSGSRRRSCRAATHLISLLRERTQRVQTWPEHVTYSMKVWRLSA